jgi:AcrR family transcriptional regulator
MPNAVRRQGIRERTRALLLDAAIRVFARQGVGATAIHEITAEAGVANGTFYNYFRTREEIAEAVGARLAERLQAEISESYRDIDDPAERLAIGCRRFILTAQRDPEWGAAALRVSSGQHGLSERLAQPVLGDLRAGRRRKRFRYSSETAALDLVSGAVLSAMRTVIERRAGAEHAGAVSAHILRALGVTSREAEKISRRALSPPRPSSA